MIKFIILFIVFISTTNATTQTQFYRFFAELNSLSAHFTQSIYNADGSLINTTSGTVLLQKPQQLRWHTSPPDEQILLLDNQQLWLVDVALEQAILKDANALKQTPLYWFINQGDTLQNSIEFAYQQENLSWYRAKTETPDYHHLLFAFSKNRLHTISLVNRLKQKIIIVFNQLKINPKLDEDAFNLALKPSFDIIRP